MNLSDFMQRYHDKTILFCPEGSYTPEALGKITMSLLPACREATKPAPGVTMYVDQVLSNNSITAKVRNLYTGRELRKATRWWTDNTVSVTPGEYMENIKNALPMIVQKKFKTEDIEYAIKTGRKGTGFGTDYPKEKEVFCVICVLAGESGEAETVAAFLRNMGLNIPSDICSSTWWMPECPVILEMITALINIPGVEVQFRNGDLVLGYHL